MKKYNLFLYVFIIFSSSSAICSPASIEDGSRGDHIIWFDKPPVRLDETTERKDPKQGENFRSKELQAENWEKEAMPLGNGRMGAMVFGSIEKERIQLNEDTIWAGPPTPKANPLIKEGIKEARELIWKGKYREADDIAKAKILEDRGSVRSYQTAGDLFFNFPEFEKSKVSNYHRELNIDTAISTTKFDIKGVTYSREVFVSIPDQVTVVRLTSSKKNALNFTANLERKYTTIKMSNNGLRMYGQAQHQGKQLGTKFETQMQILHEDGELKTEKTDFNITNATSVTFYISTTTDYNHKQPNLSLKRNLHEINGRIIDQAVIKEYTRLKFDHIKKHQSLFRRVDVQFGRSDKNKIPTDERLQAYGEGEEDLDLLELYFQFGRYLLISSSAPNSMPANLQGIWADGYASPWNADYHININIQMNYWLAQSGNLSEMHEPFLDFIERLSIKGQNTAKLFGMRGALVGHTTDAWLMTIPFGNPEYGMWLTGGAWSARHAMEHFNYTGDLVRLREQTQPMYRRFALFFLDWLTENPKSGKLVSGPSTSPENTFSYIDKETGKRETSTISMGASMDQQIIWETFSHYLKIIDILNLDDPIKNEIKRSLANLERPKIAKDGRIMEWSEDFDEVNSGHRHISHLYGLHPSNQFTYRSSPEMIEAARKTIDARLAGGGGHTGWSRAWIINQWARFKESEKFRENIRLLFKKSTLKNLLDTHAPFQIDGNFGASAGIIEALVQSHDGGIEMLPAWPTGWMQDKGYINGLRAREGFEVDITWESGTASGAEIKSLLGNDCKIILNKHFHDIVVTDLANNKRVSTQLKNDLVSFKTLKNHRYKIEIMK